MEKVLLHTCCGPCFISPLENLKKEGFDVASFFYNPNIQPYQEYERRFNCLREYADKNKVALIEGDYDIDRFFQDVVFRERVRCSICYKMRLNQAAKVAKRGKFDCFTTTLLGSPYQKHDLIKDLGEAIGKKYNIPFLYRDFREGWRKAVDESKRLGLYRQHYCGCIYSERERHQRKRKTVEKKG